MWKLQDHQPPEGVSLHLGFPYHTFTQSSPEAGCRELNVERAGATCLSPGWREPLGLEQGRVPGTASEGVCSGKGWRVREAPPAGRQHVLRCREGLLPQTLPSLAPPARPVTVRYQPPRVVSLNGRSWRWPGRCRSPEPLDSHWPFPEPQGRPQGLSYSPGLHRSPCNKGLRPRWCINKGALSRKQGSSKGDGRKRKEVGGEDGGCSCMCRLLSS